MIFNFITMMLINQLFNMHLNCIILFLKLSYIFRLSKLVQVGESK
jgi:hypothetical protein